MEIWTEARSVAFYRNSGSFFIDATVTKKTESGNKILENSIQEFGKYSIRFSPRSPKEYNWLTTWPYLAFKISHSEEKKYNAKGTQNSEVLVASEVAKCELFKADS